MKRHKRLPPPVGRLAVGRYTDAELRRMLVTDGVNRYIGADLDDERRYLAWFVAAVVRLGKGTGHGADAALAGLDAEVRSLCGRGLRVR